MKNSFFLLIFSFLIVIVGKSQTWELVWSDEFNTTGQPDVNKWNYEKGKVRNNEAQYYTPQREKNSRIEDGYLIIEAHKEPYEGMDFTSASLHTAKTKAFLYGKIEVRAKVPVGVGTWPAIWMLGTNIHEVGWPLCGEIDILEHVGFNPFTIHANIHSKAYNHGIGTNKGDSTHITSPATQFNIYSIEWYTHKIDFFLDGVKYFTFENDHKNNPETWPFDKPHYLLINLAIGGMWGGMHGIDESSFPHSYYIDYVRYYKEVEDMKSTIRTLNN